MLFIDNKYTKCYFNIIAKAQTRNSVTDYTENHHIIPKSFGGENSKQNTVRLLAREHFICHMLLVKMVDDPVLRRKMQFAINSFRRSSKNQHRHILTSAQYEMVRKQVSEARRAANIGNRYSVGFKHTPEMIEKRVKQVVGKKRSPHTDETKQKISKSTTGVKKPPGHGAKVSTAKKGIPSPLKGRILGPYSEERKQSNRKPKRTVICPHCNREGGAGNMARYHFDHCKYKL